MFFKHAVHFDYIYFMMERKIKLLEVHLNEEQVRGHSYFMIQFKDELLVCTFVDDFDGFLPKNLGLQLRSLKKQNQVAFLILRN
mgnify:CR=1 FL=1